MQDRRVSSAAGHQEAARRRQGERDNPSLLCICQASANPRPSGRLMLNYGNLAKTVAGTPLRTFHDGVTALPGFSRIPSDFSRWPTVTAAEALPAPADLEGFKQAVLALRDSL